MGIKQQARLWPNRMHSKNCFTEHASLRKDQRGSVTAIVGLCLIVLITMLGLGLDFGRTFLVRSTAQKSLDMGLLAALANQQAGLSIPDEARRIYDANFPPNYMNAVIEHPVTVTETEDGNWVGSVTYCVPTTLLRIVGKPEICTTTLSEIALLERESSAIQLTLVLDNSGSMSFNSGAGTRMQALKNSINNLTEALYDTPLGQAEKIYTSIVPFDTAVNIGASRIGWVKTYDSSYNSRSGEYNNNTKVGLRTDDYGTADSEELNFSDAPPTTEDTRYKPYYCTYVSDNIEGIPFASCENAALSRYIVGAAWACQGRNPDGSYYGCHWTDGLYRWSDDAAAPACSAPGGNFTCAHVSGNAYKRLESTSQYGRDFYGNVSAMNVPILFASTDINAIRNRVNAMTPGGDTAVSIGLQWGWNTQLPSWRGVWDPGRPTLPLDNVEDNNYMILFTDGASTAGGVIGIEEDNEITGSFGFRSMILDRAPAALQKTPGAPAPYSVEPFGGGQYLYTVPISYPVISFSAKKRILRYCEMIKESGTILYVIGYGTGASTDEPTLQACAAGGRGRYFRVTDGAQLLQAFSTIGNNIIARGTRLRR